MYYIKKHQACGFTLIELMIAVVIVGILASIAIPSYQESVRKGRRGDAKAELARLAQGEHKYRLSNTTYANSANLAVALDPTANPAPSSLTASTYYTFAVASNTGSVFTITATPKSTGGQDDDVCATLTFNQDAVISSSASSACAHP